MARWTKGESGRKRGQVVKPTTIDGPYKDDFLNDVDRRSTDIKIIERNLARLTSDLGGLANLSFQQRSLSRHAIFADFLAEKKERALLNGEPFDEGSYLLVLNCLSGLMSKLGLKRQARKIVSLEEYLKKPLEPAQPQPQAPQPSKEDDL